MVKFAEDTRESGYWWNLTTHVRSASSLCPPPLTLLLVPLSISNLFASTARQDSIRSNLRLSRIFLFFVYRQIGLSLLCLHSIRFHKGNFSTPFGTCLSRQNFILFPKFKVINTPFAIRNSPSQGAFTNLESFISKGTKGGRVVSESSFKHSWSSSLFFPISLFVSIYSKKFVWGGCYIQIGVSNLYSLVLLLYRYPTSWQWAPLNIHWFHFSTPSVIPRLVFAQCRRENSVCLPDLWRVNYPFIMKFYRCNLCMTELFRFFVWVKLL